MDLPALRAKSIAHYHLGSGVEWLLLRAPEHDDLKALAGTISETLADETIVASSERALAILSSFSAKLSPSVYSAIYHVLNDARNRTKPK